MLAVGPVCIGNHVTPKNGQNAAAFVQQYIMKHGKKHLHNSKHSDVLLVLDEIGNNML
jgi:hypothetical protein